MITWLRGLRLTLAQWALLTASALIGGLVLLLRLRGSQLHKAQVDLLASQLGRAMDQQDQKVSAAKERYRAAKKAYRESKE